MYEPKYYTLIDMDSEGQFKTALFPALDEVKSISRGKPYLEEVVPGSFWLHTLKPLADSVSIQCPKCGNKLTLVASVNDSIIRNSIYHCDRCNP